MEEGAVTKNKEQDDNNNSKQSESVTLVAINQMRSAMNEDLCE